MSKRKILIVEDEADLRSLLVEALFDGDYEIYQAGDGAEALDKAREVRPDLIITDVLMPKLRGDELVQQVKTDLSLGPVRFIVLTARKLMREYFEAMEIDDFIAKPVSGQELRDRVRAVFDKMPSSRSAASGRASAVVAPASDPSAPAAKRCIRCGEDVQPGEIRCPSCGSMWLE